LSLLCGLSLAVIGVAFNVNPPFSMTWAGGALLILEGTMMAAAVLDQFALAGLIALILTTILSYAIKAIGVNTGFPFGAYHYTNVLAPLLPGGVPLAVIFAWIMTFFLFMVINTFVLSSIFLMNLSSFTGRLPPRIAPLLYTANVFMFGLAVFAGLLLLIIAPFPRYAEFSIPVIDSIQEYDPLQRHRKRMKKAKKKKRSLRGM